MPRIRTLEHEVHYQDTGSWCGPASVRTVLGAAGVVLTEEDLAGEMHTTMETGTIRWEIIQSLERHLGATYVDVEIGGSSAGATEVATMRERLVGTVDRGYCTIVNVTGSAQDLDGNTYSYGGHYIVVVGYRAGGAEIQIMDPAKGRDYWMIQTTLANWACNRGYIWTRSVRSTVEDHMLVITHRGTDDTYWLADGIRARRITGRDHGGDVEAEIADLRYLHSEGILYLWNSGEVREGMVSAFGDPIDLPVARGPEIDYAKLAAAVAEVLTERGTAPQPRPAPVD